ncbi:MAG: hypothetical protein QM756_44045 [Polyangiaceae bacterium]
MRPSRHRLVASLLALGAALSFGATAIASLDPCARYAPLPLELRFRSGTRPSSAPVLGPDGSIYLGTSEGYVHALGRDGSYLWGYTLRGPVVGTLALGATSTLLVPTPRRIYAIRPDGTLLWVFESPLAIAAGLAPDGNGRYFFASDDGRLFGLSGRGALVASVPGSVRFSSPPASTGNKAVGVGRSDGSAVVAWLGRAQRFLLPDVPSELFACADVTFCALARGQLYGVDPAGLRFRTPALLAGAARERIAVVTAAGALEVYTANLGARVFSLALPGTASAAPSLDARGRVYVPLESGALFAVSEQGQPLGCAKLADSPLGTPVVEAMGERVFVTANEGLLLGVGVP